MPMLSTQHKPAMPMYIIPRGVPAEACPISHGAQEEAQEPTLWMGPTHGKTLMPLARSMNPGSPRRTRMLGARHMESGPPGKMIRMDLGSSRKINRMDLGSPGQMTLP